MHSFVTSIREVQENRFVNTEVKAYPALRTGPQATSQYVASDRGMGTG